MDNLFSLFGIYDLLGYTFAGAAMLCGGYWAIAGLPPESPDTVTALALLAASYAVGHLVAAVAGLWEQRLWKAAGPPSVNRLDAGHRTAYDERMRRLLEQRVESITGVKLPVSQMFAIARGQLRQHSQEARAELMNAMYGLCRNLATATGVLTCVLLVAAAVDGEWERRGITASLTALAAALYLRRALTFSGRFADQVWQDFAALDRPTTA